MKNLSLNSFMARKGISAQAREELARIESEIRRLEKYGASFDISTLKYTKKGTERKRFRKEQLSELKGLSGKRLIRYQTGGFIPENSRAIINNFLNPSNWHPYAEKNGDINAAEFFINDAIGQYGEDSVAYGLEMGAKDGVVEYVQKDYKTDIRERFDKLIPYFPLLESLLREMQVSEEDYFDEQLTPEESEDTVYFPER